MKKAKSLLRVNGQITPEANIDAVVVAKDFRLEQIEAVEKMGFDATGQLDATMSFKGKLPKPEMILIGRLRKMLIGDTPTDDSSFEIDFLPERLKGKCQLLGKQIVSSFSLPYKKEDPFDFQLKTNQLNFTSLFSMVSQTAAKKDFQSKLTTNVNLKSKKGGFWASSGQVNINEFELRQGENKLVAEKPIFIQFDRGRIRTDNFFLSGSNAFIKMELLDASERNFKGNLDAKLDMSLISVLTPFLSDLRGRLSLSLKSDGPIDDLNLIGSAFVDKGFLKLQEFPHPFEDLSTDILFNQRDIIINALKSKLGGGDLRAQGKIILKSLTEVPVSIKGDVQNIGLNIPDGVKTQGSGRISFSGTKFPYRLAGEYNVSYGDVTMEFGSDEDEDTSAIKPSEFLPQSVTKDSFQPITLDLKINLDRSIKVNNSLVEADVEGKLAVKGPPSDLIMNGLLKPKPKGIISFRDTKFIINNSYVEYRNAGPANPNVYVAAEAKVAETTLGAGGRENTIVYDIKLLVQGQSPDFNITLDSQPQLSEQQIISLLALGVTTATTAINDDIAQEGQGNDVATGVIGTSIGARIIGKQLSEPLKDRLGVEMTISTSVNAEENASYPRVILSKQWTPNWETSASRTIEKNPRNDLRFRYRFNDNLSFIGLWENRENNIEQQFIQQNQFGVDLEFRQNFK